jgi:DNA-binding MarR family transcriptional regulator
MLNLLYTTNVLSLKQTQFFKNYGISSQQYNILRILKGQLPQAATVNLLIDRMLDKSSNASRLVDKLKQKNLVSREQDPSDRRAVKVKITEEGLDLLKKIDKNITKLGPKLVVSEKEASQLNEILNKIRDNLNQNK